MSETGDNPFDQHELEDRIREKLEDFQDHSQGLHSRILRAGRYRLRVRSRERLTRRRQNCTYTPDQLAHRLSMAMSSGASTAPDGEIPPDFFRGVQEIILIPELARSDRYLLTHIYSPGRKLLAFYLYPRRFDLQNTQVPDGTSAPSGRRLDLNTAPTVPFLGLLGRVIESVAALNGSADQDNGAALHKYLVPQDVLSLEEEAELQRTHDLYSGNSL